MRPVELAYGRTHLGGLIVARRFVIGQRQRCWQRTRRGLVPLHSIGSLGTGAVAQVVVTHLDWSGCCRRAQTASVIEQFEPEMPNQRLDGRFDARSISGVAVDWRRRIAVDLRLAGV